MTTKKNSLKRPEDSERQIDVFLEVFEIMQKKNDHTTFSFVLHPQSLFSNSLI